MRLARILLPAFLIGSLLTTPLAASADVVKENASVTYSPGLKNWDFTAASASGFINITTKSAAKQLTKLKQTGLNHTCIVEYDTDSKIQAMNGDFYSVFKVSACDL